MQRFLASLVPAVFFFLLRSDLTPVVGQQNGRVAAAQLTVVRFLAERLTGGFVSDEAVGLVLVVVLLLAGFMGYVLHVILQDCSFGPYVNGVLCLFGAGAANAAFVACAPRAYVAEPSALVMISSIGAVCLLLLFALLKAALLARLDDFASGSRQVAVQRWGNRTVERGMPRRRDISAPK